MSAQDSANEIQTVQESIYTSPCGLPITAKTSDFSGIYHWHIKTNNGLIFFGPLFAFFIITIFQYGAVFLSGCCILELKYLICVPFAAFWN